MALGAELKDANGNIVDDILSAGWRNQLRDASFRGAPFKLKSADSEFGKRTKMYYSYRDQKLKNADDIEEHARDLGTFADVYKLEAYIIQTPENKFNYFEDRDKLIRALKARGPGLLIHPFYGEVSVITQGKAIIKETFDEGGIARFSITFVQERGKSKFPPPGRDWSNQVDKSALDAVNNALDNFTRIMNATGAYISSLSGVVSNSLARINRAVSSVNGAVSSATSAATSIVASSIATISNILTSPCDLANTFITAGDSFKNLYGLAGDVITSGVIGACSGQEQGEQIVLDGTSVSEEFGLSMIDSMLEGAKFEDSDLGDVPDEQLENRTLSANITKVAFYTNMSNVAVRIDFSSQNKLVEITNQISNAMEEFILELGDQEFDNTDFYVAMRDLRSTLVENLLDKGANLVKEIEFTIPAAVLSSLELAYNKYLDIDRCPDIFSRNQPELRHPAFLPEGEAIRILDR